MKIEYKNHKKIITHPSGHIDEHDKEDLKEFKQELAEFHTEIKRQIDLISLDISKL